MSNPAFNPAYHDLALSLTERARLVQSELLSLAVREGGSEDVYVRTSPIHGLGVFARRTFATGETILVREERPVTAEQPLDPSRAEFEEHCDWVEGGRKVYLGFPARHINHACEPNAFLRRQEGIRYVIALKPIRPNEEIVRHYVLNRAGGDFWTCNCGSPACLRSLPGNFFNLPPHVQLELSPLLEEWFVVEHRDQYLAFLAAAGLSEDERR